MLPVDTAGSHPVVPLKQMHTARTGLDTITMDRRVKNRQRSQELSLLVGNRKWWGNYAQR